MAIASALLRRGVGDRDIYLFDTFAGMTARRPATATFVETR